MALALAGYHPMLRYAVLASVPHTAGDSAFLADGKLSDTEIAALDRAQSVFGLEAFYRAWELDKLATNEVHAVLYILTFYDPYTTVHDVTADPDDPNAEGAELTRALDDFGVYPGTCLYCKGQKAGQSRGGNIFYKDGGIGLFRRMILLHLAHHAKVQADALSPCDLRDFTEEELIALGTMEVRHQSWREGAYRMLEHNFVASTRLTDELLAAGIDAPRGRTPGRKRTSKVLIRPGEVLSPFTHAMRAIGGPPSERGLEPCLEAVKRIVEWDVKRYDHFTGTGWRQLLPFFRGMFPPLATSEDLDRIISNTRFPDPWLPAWAWFLVDLSAGQDKSKRLMNQFRALNLPAVRETTGIYFDETAAKASTVIEGTYGVLLSPYRLYLHRNIGFAVYDYQADIDDLIRRYSFPERCRIERIGRGELEERENLSIHPGNPQDYSVKEYYVWVRHPVNPTNPYARPSPSFHRFDLRTILVYVCD